MHTALPASSSTSTTSTTSTTTRQPRTSPIARTVRFPEQGGRRHVDAESSRTSGADYVTIPVAAAITGYSPKAIRRKIEAGVWLEGREFRRAPDGPRADQREGYELWVERGRA